jgi:hypothetical protein
MKTQRWLFILTVFNFVLALVLVGQLRPLTASDVAPVLRGRALEIVDAQGRVRASITIEPPSTVDSRPYPESVLFRMRDPQTGATMKLDADADGVGMSLGGRIQLMTKRDESFVKIKNPDGREHVIRP